MKRFGWLKDATYPDFGSNTGTYTAGTFIELETLAPLSRLAPGASAEHTERWFLFRNVDVGTSSRRSTPRSGRSWIRPGRSESQGQPHLLEAFLVLRIERVEIPDARREVVEG